MNSFIKWMDEQPKLVKALLCIPFIAIIWVIYRIVLSLNAKDWLGVILGVLLVFVGIPFLWLIDLICILVQEKVLWYTIGRGKFGTIR